MQPPRSLQRAHPIQARPMDRTRVLSVAKTARHPLPLLLLAALGLSACAGQEPGSPSPGTSLAMTPPATIALRLREEAIPSDAIKFTPQTDPLPPVLHSDEWLPPVPVPGPINTAGAEDSPFITPDGNTLFFFFTPDPGIPPQQQLLDGVTGLYLSQSGDMGWEEPRRLVLADTGEVTLDGCEFLQGEVLWFCSARSGNFRGVDLWIADFRDGLAQNWRNAGERLNREIQAGEMHLSADGDTLYFHAPSADGDDLDLYLTRRLDGNWSDAEPLTALNTDADEGWPFVSEDGLEFWFTRTYQGSPAVFRSRWSETGWSAPELIVSPFAGEPTLDRLGNLYFVHHYLVDGEIREADIYLAAHPQQGEETTPYPEKRPGGFVSGARVCSSPFSLLRGAGGSLPSAAPREASLWNRGPWPAGRGAWRCHRPMGWLGPFANRPYVCARMALHGAAQACVLPEECLGYSGVWRNKVFRCSATCRTWGSCRISPWPPSTSRVRRPPLTN